MKTVQSLPARRAARGVFQRITGRKPVTRGDRRDCVTVAEVMDEYGFGAMADVLLTIHHGGKGKRVARKVERALRLAGFIH